MTTTELRVKIYERILSNLRFKLKEDEFVSIGRKALAETLIAPEWMVSRSLLALQSHDYIVKGKRQNNISTYKKSYDFDAATPEQLNEWVVTYNLNSNEKSNQKKQSKSSGYIELLPHLSPAPKQEIEHVLADYKYGFYGVEGWEWCKSIDEATDKAKPMMLEAQLSSLFIVQKVAQVNITPTVTML